MSLIKFTANYDDLSTDRGFQFRFRCDKCGNGCETRFQTFTAGVVSDVLRTAGSLFGGVLGGAGQGAYEIQRAIGGKAHDDAFAAAVEEAKVNFHQCTRCGRWVCPEVCWNAAASLCEECAPNYEEEFAASHARAKLEAAREQLDARARETDYTSATDMSAGAAFQAPAHAAANPSSEAHVPAGGVACASCGTVTNSKFCPECGHAVNQKLKCTGCGCELAGRPKFCKECGTRIEYQT
jgi:hypothetical protein